MSAKLFVGNLSPKTTGEQLTRFFSSAGIVASVRLPLDRQTGRSRGFAFVEFPSQEQAEQALRVFNGRELGGRQLRVSMARPERGNGTGSRRDIGAPVGARPLFEGAEIAGSDDWSFAREDDPYGEDHGRSRRHRGRHGSDRRRRHGTRRYLD